MFGVVMNNERESFEEWCDKIDGDTVHLNRNINKYFMSVLEQTWNHQQNKIDQLELDLKIERVTLERIERERVSLFKQNLSKEDKIQELEERNERLVQIIKNMEELPVVNEMIRLEKVSKELEKLLRMALNRIDSTWHEDFLNKPEIIKLMEK
jgi:hypothetical protein